MGLCVCVCLSDDPNTGIWFQAADKRNHGAESIKPQLSSELLLDINHAANYFFTVIYFLIFVSGLKTFKFYLQLKFVKFLFFLSGFIIENIPVDAAAIRKLK